MNAKSSWKVYRTRFLVHARQLTHPLVFTDLLGREHSGQPGDYLVETSDGIRRITSRALFEDIYVPLLPDSDVSPSADAPHSPPSHSMARPVASLSSESRSRIIA